MEAVAALPLRRSKLDTWTHQRYATHGGLDEVLSGSDSTLRSDVHRHRDCAADRHGCAGWERDRLRPRRPVRRARGRPVVPASLPSTVGTDPAASPPVTAFGRSRSGTAPARGAS